MTPQQKDPESENAEYNWGWGIRPSSDPISEFSYTDTNIYIRRKWRTDSGGSGFNLPSDRGTIYFRVKVPSSLGTLLITLFTDAGFTTRVPGTTEDMRLSTIPTYKHTISPFPENVTSPQETWEVYFTIDHDTDFTFGNFMRVR